MICIFKKLAGGTGYSNTLHDLMGLRDQEGHCCGREILMFHENRKQDILKKPRESGNMKANKKAKLV